MSSVILKLKLGSALCAFGLLVPLLCCGQGFVYLSNTNQNSISNVSWGGNTHYIPFTTGSNPLGYLINSVSVFSADNVPSVLTGAAIDGTFFQDYKEVGSTDYYTFTPNSPLSLAANTSYSILVFTPDSFASVNLSYTTSSTVSTVDNWSVPWSNGVEVPLFSIIATPIAPVPEPTVTSLICASVFILITFRIERHGLNRKVKA